MNIPPPLRNLDDGITHHLAGAVIGDVAASSRLEQFHSKHPKSSFGKKEVSGSRVASEGDHRVVLEEKQGVANRSALPLINQGLLKLKTMGVGNPAEVSDVEESLRPARPDRLECLGGRS